MPIVDGLFVPNTPLTPAEAAVDFVLHNSFVLERRRLVEQSAAPLIGQIAIVIAQTGVRPIALRDKLAVRLKNALLATARFGYREARREIRVMRAREGAQADLLPKTIADYFRGADAFKALEYALDSQSHAAAQDIVQSEEEEDAERQQQERDWAIRAIDVRDTGLKRLHNNVLDLVGNSLNLGRTAGATSLQNPPKYSMRSEQLDKTMCEPCGALHGTIVEVDSAEYWGNLPPIGCLGGGRCRGIMVYADGVVDLHRAPDPTQEELDRIRKVQQPSIDELARNKINIAKAAEPGVTRDLKEIAGQRGGTMEGLDFRLKTQASLERKIRSDMATDGLAAAQASRQINDALRYTMNFDEGAYTNGVSTVLEDLGKRGYKQIKVKNFWGGDDDYEGINSVFESPGGQRFELQFHTPTSLHVKSALNHPLYMKFRTSSDPREKARLWDQMVNNAKRIPTPRGAHGLGGPGAHARHAL